MSEVLIDREELIRNVSEQAEEAIEDVVRCAIEKLAVTPDEIDSERCGELIRENGWTLYDLSVDLDDLIDNNLPDYMSISEVLRHYEPDDIFHTVMGSRHSLGTLVTEFVDAAKARHGADAVQKALSTVGSTDPVAAATAAIKALAPTDEEMLNVMLSMGWQPAPVVPTPRTEVIGSLEWDLTVYVNKTYAEAQTLAAHAAPGGWRLPTVSELIGTIKWTDGDCADRWGHTKTLWCREESGIDGAWVVVIGLGMVRPGDKDSDNAVRLVRDVK